MNLLPLWTAKVCPTKSGITVLDRDHVLTTRFSFREFIAATRLSRLSAMYGPFLTLRAIYRVSGIIGLPSRACGRARSAAETPSWYRASSHPLSCPMGSQRCGHHVSGHRVDGPPGS